MNEVFRSRQAEAQYVLTLLLLGLRAESELGFFRKRLRDTLQFANEDARAAIDHARPQQELLLAAQDKHTNGDAAADVAKFNRIVD